MDAGVEVVSDDGSGHGANIANVSVVQRYLALFLLPQEGRLGHRVRVHGHEPHLRGYGRFEEENEHGDILSAAQA